MFAEETWAESWERRAQLIDHLVPLLMAELRPRPGERILDIGAGLAPATISAAAAVAPGGVVHAVDISAPVLARARRRIKRANLANVHLHQLDAERALVPGRPFDAAMSLLGVMFFEDPVAAFANVRAQLRPGGRVAFLTWAEPSANPLLAEVMLDRFVPRTLHGDTSGSFSLSDPVRFHRLLEGAGFIEVEIVRRGLHAVVDESVLFDELLLDVYGVEERQKPTARLFVQETLRASRGFGGAEVSLAVNIATGGATL